MITVFNEDSKINRGYSHITELILIGIKSLLPSETFEKVYVDYRRYNEEIKLWFSYRQGENQVLLNLFKNIDLNLYLNGVDDTLPFRILPIIMVNKDFNYTRDEVIKNVLFTSGNIEKLIETVLIGKIFFLLINTKEYDLIEELKDEVINFSQNDFISTYNDYYRLKNIGENKRFKIQFEQAKINLLNILNFKGSGNFPILEDSLEVVSFNKEPRTIIGKSIWALLNKRGQGNLVTAPCKRFIKYLYKLRRGRINPDQLKINEYILPDVFQFQEGDEFFHSLLNRCRVIKKEELGNRMEVSLITKSGIYKFRK